MRRNLFIKLALVFFTLLLSVLAAVDFFADRALRHDYERTGFELALLEPPALFAQNYGRRTVAVTLLAHVAYGAILGGFLKP